MDPIWIWTIVIAGSLLIEALTVEMVAVWLAAGGVVGLILALIGGIDIGIQIIVVVVVAILCIVFLRKFTLKFLRKGQDKASVEIVLGKKSKLLEDVSPSQNSTLKLNGTVWTVICDEELPKGTEVEIIEIKGNKLKVKKGE